MALSPVMRLATETLGALSVIFPEERVPVVLIDPSTVIPAPVLCSDTAPP